MPDYLLELRSEEIPARMQPGGAEALDRSLTAALREAGLAPERTEAHATARRLIWIGRGIPPGTEAREEVRRGPRVGAPEKALAGFLRSAGVERDALQTEGEGVAARYVARRRIPGRSLDDCLAEIVPAALRGLRWPKSMRWGRGGFRWVRPLRSIVSLIEEDGAVRVAPFDLEGIPVDRSSSGHPFLSSGALRADSVSGYLRQLEAAFVCVSAEARRARILEGAGRLAEEYGWTLVDDQGLVEELAGLAEWPVVHSGQIEPEFRHLPDEVLRSAMRTHQRFLSLRDPVRGEIAGYVAVADTDPADGGERIRTGYARVLRARLADAAFFWENDRRLGLEAMRAGLQGMVYHARLGGVLDRTERVAALAERVARHLGADAAQARRAALLAKCDLASGTVGEFPALQGTVGGRLAELAGEAPSVVAAIAGQYRPAGPSDTPVTDPVAAALAIAERADSLYGFFAAGLRPTGSRDPFALRRSALALLRTVEENRLRLPVSDVVAWAEQGHAGMDLPNREDAAAQAVAFVLDRLSVSLRERGYAHDSIAAVRAAREDTDPVSLAGRVEALTGFLAGGGAADDVLAAYTRVRSILDQERFDGPAAPPEAGLLERAEERDLAQAISEADGAVEAALAGEAEESALAALATLREPVDRFFDRVKVNDESATLRDNRLRLLLEARRVMERVAALGELEGR